MISLVSLPCRLTGKLEPSDATHMLSATLGKKEKQNEARENTDGTLLALSKAYFGHVGM